MAWCIWSCSPVFFLTQNSGLLLRCAMMTSVQASKSLCGWGFWAASMRQVCRGQSDSRSCSSLVSCCLMQAMQSGRTVMLRVVQSLPCRGGSGTNSLRVRYSRLVLNISILLYIILTGTSNSIPSLSINQRAAVSCEFAYRLNAYIRLYSIAQKIPMQALDLEQYHGRAPPSAPSESFSTPQRLGCIELNMSDLYYENGHEDHDTSIDAQKQPTYFTLGGTQPGKHDYDAQPNSEVQKRVSRLIQQFKHEADTQAQETPPQGHPTVGQATSKRSIKSRHEIFSGVSFSRFEELSDSGSVEEQPGPAISIGNVASLKDICVSRNAQANAACSTSSLELSPAMQKHAYMNVRSFNRLDRIAEEYKFEVRGLDSRRFKAIFSQFAKLKKMDIQDRDGKLIATRRVPLYKMALKMCFPSSEEFDPELYQFHSSDDGTGVLSQVSGSPAKYYSFKDELLVYLWTLHHLQCGGLQQNIRYFVKFVNSSLNKHRMANFSSEASSPQHQIDQLRAYIDRTLRVIFVTSPKKNHGESQKKSSKKIQEQEQEVLCIPEIGVMKTAIFIFEQSLKQMYSRQAEEMREYQDRNAQKVPDMNSSKQSYQPDYTPLAEKVLMSTFYNYLDLEKLVTQIVIGEAVVSDFEKKRAMIKGGLSISQKLGYLELEQIYSLATPEQKARNLFPCSLKILSSVTFGNFPCPAHALEALSIFRSNLSKEVDLITQAKCTSRVKLPTYSEQQQSLLRLFIFCLVQAQNPDIFAMVEVAKIFSPLPGSGWESSHEGALANARLLKRAILFIQNDWQL